MQQSIQSYVQTLNSAQVSGGLDFDGSMSGTPAGGGDTAGLEFTASITPPGNVSPSSNVPSGDALTVDARNVASGLTKDLDNAIAGAYAGAPPGVSERVSKGFQALMVQDWKLAKAWFEDALSRDPANEGLKRFVALADIPGQNNRQSASVDNRNVPDVRRLQLPENDDIYFLFQGEEVTAPLSEPAREEQSGYTTDVYIYNPSSGYKRVTRDEAAMIMALDDIFGVPHLQQIPVYNADFPSSK